jgi:hypothetical protein
MFFTVLPHRARLPNDRRDEVVLLTDNWDDWFTYSTMYILFYYDNEGGQHRIGEVKIGQFNMAKDQRRPTIPDEFDSLGEQFFSLGQDDRYYETLSELGPEIRQRILGGLRDTALDAALFERTLAEKVTGVSLLRSVTRSSVRGQFRRLANGGARLTSYAFSYTPPKQRNSKSRPPVFEFKVEPESNPPTNIHVLIGRNGVGKTYHFNLMTRALVEPESPSSEVGEFADLSQSKNDSTDDSELAFENVVSVTFSAFDPFEPLPGSRDRSEGVRYQYIGLKRTQNDDGTPRAPKTPGSLGREFGASVRLVRSHYDKLDRWRKALAVLEADPIFKAAEIADLANEESDDAIRKQASKIFENLSSGHKIVLLTITRLVETVEEQTLVLLDEPEAHLHPPLLSAFVRALSNLLTNRNGVAIVATHSPVVLQEVPSECVWKMRRSGREVVIERPDLQTFGENVGVLTREVFGLEVTDSGFHQLLARAVEENDAYEDVVESFGDQLGGEARAIVRGLMTAERDDD